MDSEDKKALKETLELSKDNNRILHKIQRANTWAKIFRIFYWVLIIGSMVSAYYFIQPMVNQLLKSYSDVISQVEGVKQLGKDLPGGILKPGAGGDLNIPPELLDQFKSILEGNR